MLIIPTYNERANVRELVERIRKTAVTEPILFVDDNSPDGTAGEIQQMQRNDPDIHLMVRPSKAGYGSACREGMQQILHQNLAHQVIQFDADLSHPPELLPQMLELLRSNPVVIGSRYVAGGGSQNWNFPRRCLSRGANWYARFWTGVPVHDMTAGFVGYQTEILRRIPLEKVRSEGYAFHIELLFHLHRSGTSFHEFPIIFRERENGRSKFERKIVLEGIRFPFCAAARRIAGR